jgi:hypothetical protein
MPYDTIYYLTQAKTKSFEGLQKINPDFRGFCVAASCYWLRLRLQNSEFPSTSGEAHNPANPKLLTDLPLKVKELFVKHGRDETAICQALAPALYIADWWGPAFPTNAGNFNKIIQKFVDKYNKHRNSWNFLLDLHNPQKGGHMVAFRWIQAQNEFECFDCNRWLRRYYGGPTMTDALEDLVDLYANKGPNQCPEADIHMVSNAQIT